MIGNNNHNTTSTTTQEEDFDNSTKIQCIVESLLEEIFEQNLKDLCSAPTQLDTVSTYLLQNNNNSNNNNNYQQQENTTSNNNSTINNTNSNNSNIKLKEPFLSTILINEQDLKLKIILFKRILTTWDVNSNGMESNCDNNTGLGITIAFLTEGFYGCELITIFDTDHTLSSLKNKIQEEYNQLIENNSCLLIQPTVSIELKQKYSKEEFSNSIEESFVLDFVFSHLVEPFANVIIPLYNHLFSHCKTSNLLFRNNLILLLEDIDNREDNLFAILFHNITCLPLQYCNPTTIKAPILTLRMLNRESFEKIQSRGLTRYLLQEGFNNVTFPTTYWNRFSKMLNQSVSNLCNISSYKDHYERGQQPHFNFYTLSQITDFTMITNTTDYSSSYLKIGSDLFPQPITVALSTTRSEVTINIPSGMHQYLIRSLNEMNSKHQNDGILINCGIYREFFQDFGYLLSDGSTFTRNSSGKCSNWAFSLLRFDWCFDLQRDEIEFDKDILIVKCCAQTMEDLLSSLYYHDNFTERVIYSNKNVSSNDLNDDNYLLMINWDKNRSLYYYQTINNQAIPIDYDLFSLSGLDYFDPKEIKYKKDHILSCSIEQIILLSPSIHFSTRITAKNMVKLVEFVFCTFSKVFESNPTLPLDIIDRFDIIVNCLDYGCVNFDLNSYYDKIHRSSKLKKEWIDRHLNIRKVLKEFISSEQLFSFVGPKLSFSIHFNNKLMVE